MVRKNSLRDIKPNINNNYDTVDSNNKNGSESVNHFDFKPHGGVTFRENHKSDVAIVGKGYHDDSHHVEPKPAQYAVKAKRKPSKGKRFERWNQLNNSLCFCKWISAFTNIHNVMIKRKEHCVM